MDLHFNNLDIVQEFQEYYDLKDGYGNSQFNALIFFNINGRERTEESRVLIMVANYGDEGKVAILKSELDSHVYPVEFSAQYQTYSLTDENELRIDGVHRTNPMIGKYTVIIKPLK